MSIISSRTILALAALAALPRPGDAQQWSELGGSGSAGGISQSPDDASSRPSVACDSSGFPIVAWGEKSKIWLRRWDGNAWVGLGGSDSGSGLSLGAGVSSGPSLALDSSGNPVVAWRGHADDRYQVFVRRWNGMAWIPYGDSASGGRIVTPGAVAIAPVLVLDSADRAFVAWEEQDAMYIPQIFVFSWDGRAWSAMGGPGADAVVSNALYSARTPSLGLDAAGLPIVSWVNADGDEFSRGQTQVFVRRWDAGESAWVGFGGSDDAGEISQSLIYAYSPAIAVDASGKPVVAWAQQDATDIDLAVRVYVKEWTGNEWLDVGYSSNYEGILPGIRVLNQQGIRGVSIALDSAGRPAVSWTNRGTVTSTHTIRLLRWMNGVWSEVAGSATGLGVSMAQTHCANAFVALNAYDDLFVAWDGAYGGDAEVSLRGCSAPVPSIQGSPQQFHLDGVTPIPAGGLVVGEDGLVAAVAADDPLGRNAFLDAEVRPLGQPFLGIATTSSAALPLPGLLTVAATGLGLDQSYHWQVRLRVGTRSFPWIAFGANPESEPDVRLRSNSAPLLHALFQGDSRSPDPAGVGRHLVGDDGIRFTGRVEDPDGDDVRIEVECVPVSQVFSGSATASGSMAASGGVSTAISRPPVGSNHWQARAADPYGMVSPWISFGGNSESDADFILEIWGGSVGIASCTQAGLPATSIAALATVLLLAELALGIRPVRR